MRRMRLAHSAALILACVLYSAVSEAQGLTDAQIQELLNLHNQARCNVQPTATTMPALIWDPRLQQVAQNFANSCPGLNHNANRTDQYNDLGGPALYVGENIFSSGGSSISMTTAVQYWVSESANYNYSNNSCSGICGHYTQVVWAATTKIGCGVAYCPAQPFPSILVCNYAPGGNTGGRPYAPGTGPTASCNPQVSFDPNGDGAITIDDLFYLINHLYFGSFAPVGGTPGGDANSDTALSSADLIYLLNYLFAAGPAP